MPKPPFNQSKQSITTKSVSNNAATAKKKLSKHKNSRPVSNPFIVLFNKPFNTLCQFTGEKDDITLANFIKIPKVYPAGRLDKDSEGLLILTNCGKTQHKISHPKFNKWKTYWVQVEGELNDEAINKLSKGVKLKDGLTKPAKVERLDPHVESQLWTRNPPIRQRKNKPTSWLSIAISEGKNRQVRRMTAAVGFPTLRLIRKSIDQWTIDNLQPGEYQIIKLKRARVC